MRWKFCDVNNPDEWKKRGAIIRHIDAWWNAFESKAGEIDKVFSRKSNFDIPRFMQSHLPEIARNIFWEFGAGLKGGHRLVITPESHRTLRPIVETILDRAPKMSGWEFYPHRLPEDVEQANAAVEGRVGTEITSAVVSISQQELHRIELTYHFPAATFHPKKSNHAAFVATEALLGEDVLDRWIGGIRAEKLTSSKGTVPLEKLRPAVQKCIAQIQGGMLAQPCWQIADGKWTMWKLKPKEAADYPDQFDLFVGKSMLPEMWQTAHSNRSFYSCSFSRCGEVFCYVKLDGSQGLDQEKFKDKAEIEDALDDRLKKDQCGAVIGGGTGLRYSYIDLALTDVSKGIAAVQEVLQNGNVHPRSWIQFFDSEWKDEWAGIWKHSPPPPMVSDSE